MKKLALLVVSAALIVPALPVKADAAQVSAWTVNYSKAVANTYWINRGHTACTPVFVTPWMTIHPGWTNDELMQTFLGPIPNGSMYCQVGYNHTYAWTPRKFCYGLVHEYGHLVGIGHSPQPFGQVMSPYGLTPIAECNAAWPT